MMFLLSFRPALRALAGVLCACLLLLAGKAAAQTGFTPPGPPTAGIAPDTGDKATASLQVIVTWRDTTLRAGLDPSTATVTVTNGSIASSFVYQSVAQADAGDVEATSTGTISLAAGQTATVTARICNNLNNCSATVTARYRVRPPPQVVALASSGARPRNEPLLERFRVINPNAKTIAYTLSAVCDGTTVCQPGAGTVMVGAGDTVIVGVNYSLSTSMGSVGVTARDALNANATASTIVLSTLSAGPPGGVGDRTDLTLNERSMCVTAAVGPGAAYECGDLRLVHPLPPVRVLNRDRTPVLIYNSQWARPSPIIAAHVIRDFAMPRPDSLAATLAVDGMSGVTQRFRGVIPDTARVAIGFDASAKATGVYGYTLSVTAFYPDHSTDVVYSRTGSLAVVNRAASSFGRGWWLAGVEQLVAAGDGFLWVGGDGSTRLYRPTTDGTAWAAQLFDRPDTLFNGTGGEHFRKLPGGTRIYFNAAGQHVRTVNALGQTTAFTWSGSQLAQIALPAGGLAYTFAYNGGLLAEVVAPGPGGVADSARVVRLETAGTDVIRIWDPRYRVNSPAGSALDYTRPYVQLATSGGRIATRIDRAGVPTQLRYDAAGLLAGTALPLAPGDSIRLAFRPAESQGLAAAVAESAVYTWLDGPRTDVGDTTRFYLDRWGAPVRVVDALGNATQIRRGSTRLPAAVTNVTYANGRQVAATYDDRGNLLGTTDLATQAADGRYATTVYDYDLDWDRARRTTGAEGTTSSTAYDAAGRPVWAQTGPDAARRVTFQYVATGNGAGLVASVTQPAIVGSSPAAVESYGYDARGNLASVTSPMSVSTQTLSDAIGRPIRTRQPIDLAGTLFQSDSTVYDERGLVARTESYGPPVASSRTGRPASPAQRVVVVNSYDKAGRVTAVSRISSPDPVTIDTVKTAFAYDAAGRKIAELAPDTTPLVATDNPVDSTRYDAAGNVVRARNRMGDTVTFTYDALNRLKRRTVPAVTRVGARTRLLNASWYFPQFRDNGTGALETANIDSALVFTLPGETADFTYDATGNLLAAVNGDAVVRRTYYPNGLLQTETQRIRSYTGQDTTTHAYLLQYQYDLEGRRTALSVPTNLAPTLAQDTQRYAYDGGTGELLSIGDVVGTTYAYQYDIRGRITTFTRNGVQERYTYDNDGRMTRRYEEHLSSHQALHDETMTYDGRGKLSTVQTLQGDTVQNDYTGLGALAGTYRMRQLLPVDEERFRTDALGNRYTAVTRNTEGFKYTTLPDTSVSTYERSTGRLRVSRGEVMTDTSIYDRAGNRTFVFRQQQTATPYDGHCAGTSWWNSCAAGSVPANLVEEVVQFYGGDGRLRLLDRRTCLRFDDNPSACDSDRVPLGNQRSAFEEYRYDALGRRILVRSRQAYLCRSNCQNVARRTVWDGDQVLAEIQAPAPTGGSAAQMETDRGLVVHVDAGSVVLPDSLLDDAELATTDTLPQGQIYRGFHFGRVLYTHGPGIDAPLSLLRMDYSDSLPAAQLVVLHSDWRGEYDIGSYAGGTLTKPCRQITRSANFQTVTPDGQISDYPKFSGPLNTTWKHCVEVEWPAPHVWVTRETRNRTVNGPLAWMGTLVDGMRDNSGQMYMRNRYYDPASGRFTQEDPIGLAGGLNAYGFAGGDPVSYSDPFGLKVCFDGRGGAATYRQIIGKLNSLVRAAHNATNLNLRLSQRNSFTWCVTSATAATTDTRYRDLQDKFQQLLARTETYTIASSGGESNWDRESRTAYIGSDVGNPIQGCHNAVMHSSLESTIVHELLGHGTESPWAATRIGKFFGFNERYATQIENEYHSIAGEDIRCRGTGVENH